MSAGDTVMEIITIVFLVLLCIPFSIFFTTLGCSFVDWVESYQPIRRIKLKKMVAKGHTCQNCAYKETKPYSVYYNPEKDDFCLRTRRTYQNKDLDIKAIIEQKQPLTHTVTTSCYSTIGRTKCK